MCEQCSAGAYLLGEVLPGWYLVRATRDGLWMKAGDWGLARKNDPRFIWSGVLVPDPYMEGEIGNLFDSRADHNRLKTLIAIDPTFKERSETFNNIYDDFQEALYGCDPMTGWELVEACMKAGYDRKKRRSVERWLADRIGRFLVGKDFEKIRQEQTDLHYHDNYLHKLREQRLVE